MTKEIYQYAHLLSTKRLQLTLLDPHNPSDASAFVSVLTQLARDLFPDKDPTQNALASLEYYSHYSRIDAQLLNGKCVDRAAIWLIYLSSDLERMNCIGCISMVQRFSNVPDQGWVLVPEYRGRGYAIEAGGEVLRYFRQDLGLKHAIAPTHPTNPKSRQVATRLGYVMLERKLKFQDGLLDLNALPGSVLPPEDELLERFAIRSAVDRKKASETAGSDHPPIN